MHMWEYNAYLKGYKDKLYQEQVNIMKLAYYSGMFSRDTKGKPKSLEYYLDKMERQYRKDDFKEIPVDTVSANNIFDQIQKLKNNKELME